MRTIRRTINNEEKTIVYSRDYEDCITVKILDCNSLDHSVENKLYYIFKTAFDDSYVDEIECSLNKNERSVDANIKLKPLKNKGEICGFLSESRAPHKDERDFWECARTCLISSRCQQYRCGEMKYNPGK